MMHQTKTARLSLLLTALQLPACSAFNGKGVISQKLTSFLGIVDPSSAKTPTETLRAGVLAVGEDISAELGMNLTAAGLTSTESELVVAAANKQLAVAAGTIAIASLQLAGTASTQPISYAAAPLIQGAVTSLADTGVGLTDLTRRTSFAKVIMGSTFSSLGGRIGNLPVTDLLTLQKGMIGSAVKALNDGGLGGNAAVNAVQALTSGAVEALGKSVSGTGASDAAAGIAAGAVEGLTSNGLPLDQIGAMVGAATAGVVASLNKAGITDTGAAASAIAKSSVSSLKSLAMSEANVLLATTGAASGAIGALTATGVSIDKIAAIAKQVATASVSALKDAGVSSANMGKAAGAVANGAIQGLGVAGMTPTQIADTKSVSAICVGAAGGLTASGVAASAVGSAIGDIATSAVVAMSTAMSKATLSQQQSVMGDVMNGSAQSILVSGMSKSDSQAAMTAVTQKSVEALPPSIFSAAAMSTMAATVVGQGLANSLSVGIVSNADASKMASSIGAAVGAGAAKTRIGIDANAMLMQISSAANSAGITNASSMMTSAFSGATTGAALASGAGTNSVLGGMSAALTSGAAFAGISGGIDSTALTSSMQQSVTAATALATTVGQGKLPDCSADYSDDFADATIFAKVQIAAQPVLCATAHLVCPIPREGTTILSYWTPLGSTGVCQFVATPKAGASSAALLPSCTQLSGFTTMNSYAPLYNAQYDGVPCLRASATSGCPAVPTDAGSSFSWSSLTIEKTGDACLLSGQPPVAPTSTTSDGGGTTYNGGGTTYNGGGTTYNGGGTSGAAYYGYPPGITSVASVPLCGDLGVTSGFSLSVLDSMFNPASSPYDYYCRAAITSSCYSPNSSLRNNFVFGPAVTGADASTFYCHYSKSNLSCSSLFGANATVNDSMLDAAAMVTKFHSNTGDVQCYAATCPSLTTSARYAYYSSSFAPTGGNICAYERQYSTCPTFASTVTQSTLDANYTAFDGQQKVFLCNKSGSPTIGPLDSALVTAGFTGPITWGSYGGARSAVIMGGENCADLALAGTITSTNISNLPFLKSSMARGCDVPIATACPTVGASASFLTATYADFTAIGYKRCIYNSPLPTCASTIDVSTWPSLFLSSFNNQSGRVHGCDTDSTCPSLSSNPGDFQPMTLSNGSPNRCIYQTNVSICSSIPSPSENATMMQRFGYNQPYTCDLAPAQTICPDLPPSLSAGHPATAPTSLMGGILSRCSYAPASNAAPSCAGLAGGTWVGVPGDAVYGTAGFCVQKYIPSNVSSVATSQTGTNPWVSISQTTALTTCTNLGVGYHLITNPEWMTIAANIANTASNWSNGVVGSGTLAAGHGDNSPTTACAADASDANGWVETNCTGQTQGALAYNQRRTRDLSNGNVIWDIGGNVWQWVNASDSSGKPGSATSAWNEYSAMGAGTANWPRSAFVPQNSVQSWWTDSWYSAQSIGKIYPGTNGSGGALLRGANWPNGSGAGPFAVNLSLAPSGAFADIGFRCAWQP